MTNRVNCRSVEEDLTAAASGSNLTAVAEHLRACRECERLVRRERRLLLLLASVPDAPRARFDAPRLPDEPAGRALAIPVPAWVAAAAAVVLVATLWRWSEQEGTRIRIDRVVDVAGAPPQVDERLLALTFGAEAVAMRRPTEAR